MTSRVHVVGDVMLDVSEDGEVTRVSPEAPVVVLRNPVVREALGGAANTAANVQSLGASAEIFGVVGTDDAGRRCQRLARAAGMGRSLFAEESYRTTVKRRFLSGGHQIMRLDIEEDSAPADARKGVASSVEDAMFRASGVVLSDYAKGVVTADLASRVIAAAAGLPVVVDSKATDLAIFRGCTVIAPNHHEAAAATGLDDPRLAAQAIAERTASAVVVTLGAQGMLLLEHGSFTHIPSAAVAVADVTGAGDTVTAALAVALSEGESMREAVRWANAAAAVAVAHPGTHSVVRAEVDRGGSW